MVDLKNVIECINVELMVQVMETKKQVFEETAFYADQHGRLRVYFPPPRPQRRVDFIYGPMLFN